MRSLAPLASETVPPPVHVPPRPANGPAPCARPGGPPNESAASGAPPITLAEAVDRDMLGVPGGLEALIDRRMWAGPSLDTSAGRLSEIENPCGVPPIVAGVPDCIPLLFNPSGKG